MTAKQRAAKHYLPLYQDALISAAGYAKICGYDEAAKILHKMSVQALTNQAECDKIKTTSAMRENKEVKTMKKIKIQWINGTCRLQPDTPCICAFPAYSSAPKDVELYAEFPLESDDFVDDEPTEDADNRAADYLREEITKQAKETGIPEEMLEFTF